MGLFQLELPPTAARDSDAPTTVARVPHAPPSLFGFGFCDATRLLFLVIRLCSLQIGNHEPRVEACRSYWSKVQGRRSLTPWWSRHLPRRFFGLPFVFFSSMVKCLHVLCFVPSSSARGEAIGWVSFGGFTPTALVDYVSPTLVIKESGSGSSYALGFVVYLCFYVIVFCS